MPKKPFILYIATSTQSLVALLAQQDENGKDHIYYISITLIDYKKWYTTIGKKCLALVFTTYKL